MRPLSRKYPSDLPAWQKLQTHHKQKASQFDLNRFFARDSRRAQEFSLRSGDLFLDYSKNLVDRNTRRLLCQLARQADVESMRDAMFAGEHINSTEDRAVLHVALRAKKTDRFRDGGQNCTRDVLAVRAQMSKFVSAVHRGAITGSTGERFTDIVNIGIGGSDLGVVMATRALSHLRGSRPSIHFVSNVDGTQIADLKKDLDPAKTLFVICSKTFTTQETMSNAGIARRWVKAKLGDRAISAHFAAASTNHPAMDDFGIDPAHRFEFWDWVGGRYSLWSAVGLSIALAVGWKNFQAMLDGARHMDRHFRTAPIAENMPVVMALLAVWYSAFYKAQSHAILPYDNRLDRFPAFLQQLQMESNGKSVRVDGKDVCVPTGQIIWGEAGNNAQHSFYQLLHQGNRFIPVDFLLPANSSGASQRQHDLAIANCLAQSRALMTGRSLAEISKKRKLDASSGSVSAEHRVHPGNRPSTTIIFPSLSAGVLGQLVALYEHKVFVEGVILGVNSFDQWGVQLGKVLAGEIQTQLGASNVCSDGSTKQLIHRVGKLRQ